MKIKNWDNFQHYKDRCPPWLKLHRSLIDDVEYHFLSPLAGKLLPLIWIIGSEHNGSLPALDKLIFRLRTPKKEMQSVLDELHSAGFLIDAEPAEQVATPADVAKSNGYGSRHISDLTKRFVWERDGGKCVQCGCADEIEYDHKVPVSKGGNSEQDNIQLLCRPCNRSKRAKLATQRLGRRSLEGEGETEREGETECASRKVEFDKGFLEFYLAYPKKKAKKSAAKAYAAARREVSHEVIMAGLLRAGRSDPRWRDPEFIPYPASWLRAGCYEDEATTNSFSRPSDIPNVL